MDDRITTVLEDAFPDREVRYIHSTSPSRNEKNRTVEIEFTDGETVYLKTATDGDGSRIARERAVISSVRANGDVSVPAILACDSSVSRAFSNDGWPTWTSHPTNWQGGSKTR